MAISDRRVAVVDDHAAVRQGLQSMLESEDGLEPVAAVASAREALEVVEASRPDIAVLDYHLPDEDGLTLCLRLKRLPHPPLVLVYSAFADDLLVLLATVSGADELVSKAALAEELCAALHAVADGERRLPPISPAVMEAAASGLPHEDLSIVGMLIHGTPAGEIAETLRVDEEWLTARRWAILEQLRGRPARRS